MAQQASMGENSVHTCLPGQAGRCVPGRTDMDKCPPEGQCQPRMPGPGARLQSACLPQALRQPGLRTPPALAQSPGRGPSARLPGRARPPRPARAAPCGSRGSSTQCRPACPSGRSILAGLQEKWPKESVCPMRATGMALGFCCSGASTANASATNESLHQTHTCAC